MEALPREADVVVIGAGALGSSTAFHLAAAGGRRVVLIDRHAIASQTSPRAAGLTQQMSGHEAMSKLARRSCAQIASFAADTGQPMVFFQSGSVKLARNEEHAAQLRDEVARAELWGIPLRAMDPSDVPRLSPFVRPEGVPYATHNPEDIYLEPVQIPRGYALAARERGALVVEHTAVERLLTKNGRVAGVATARGEISAPVVVDAAGAWTRPVAATGGATVAVVPTRHQLLISEPIEGVRPEQPIVRVVDANVYVRPDNGGLMLGGYERDPRQLPDALDDVASMELDLGVLRRLADLVKVQLPVFQGVFERGAIRIHRGGLPTVTPDGQKILGAVSGLPGLFVASGCNVGGLSTAPALGEALAELIVSGKSTIDVGVMSPDRFPLEVTAGAGLAAAARRQYAYQYWRAKPALVEA